MDRINVLYLSDLHISPEKSVDQDIVLNAFFDDLRRQCDSDLAPAYIVFSGDLVNNPDEPGAYEHFIEKMLLPCLEITGLDLDSFIFCAGNHDVSRTNTQKYPVEVDAIVKHLGNHDFFNTHYTTKTLPTFIEEKFAPYTSFVTSLSAAHRTRTDLFFNVWDFPASRLSFVSLNSAILSLAGLNGNEQGRLNFPDAAVNGAFGRVPNGHFVFSLQHHPFAWLEDKSADEIQKTVFQRSQIHVFGHLHQARPATQTSPLGKTTLIQAPSLFSSRNFLNGYSIISVSPDRQKIAATFRTYFEERRSFRPAENVDDGGIFYADEESKKYWGDQPLNVNLKKFRRWLTETALIEKLDTFNETTIEGRRLSDLFVLPPVVKIEARQKDDTKANDPFSYERIGYDKFFLANENILLFFPAEHGQSSFARQTALNYLIRNSEFSTPRVPLIVDCQQLRKYEASLLGLLKASAPDLSSLGKRIETIYEEGLAAVIFENTDVFDAEKRAVISNFMTKYPKNRYWLLVRSSITDSVDALLELKFPNVDLTLHAQPFTRSLVREFLRKWKLNLKISEAATVDQLVARFRVLGLPLTPVYLTLLFRIFEQDSSFQPTNSASLVENFVDRVLGKNKTDASRRAFDYKNRISLLAYFAEKMTLTGKYLVEFTELYGWANEYFKSIEIQHDVHQLITEFCEARIFALRGNSIQFQHDMFLSYFSAQRMISSNDFARIIIEQAQRFPKEIDIFCGIRRFDETIIGILEEKFADVDRRLLAEFPGLPPLTFVSEFQVPKHETVDAIFTSVTNQLTGARLSDSERDKMLEDDQEAEIEKSTNQLARPAAKYVAIEWLETLRAYTVALKNLEEISAEKKAHHLVIVLDAWARAIGYLITLIRNAFDAEIDLGGGVKLDLGKTFGDSKPFLLRWLFISMPNTISNILRYDLGTEKLQALLRKSQPAGNEPVPIRFLNEGLYLDMQLPEFLRRIQALKDSIRDNRFFSESLLLKLQDCYVRFPVKDDGTDVAFRNLLAELTVELAGDRRGIEKDKAISAAVEDVKKKQLIARLRGDEQ